MNITFSFFKKINTGNSTSTIGMLDGYCKP